MVITILIYNDTKYSVLLMSYNQVRLYYLLQDECVLEKLILEFFVCRCICG
jgi:hypothetical protein